MRVAIGMDIAAGPIDADRHLEHRHDFGCKQQTGLPRRDPAITGLAREQGQPASLQIGAGTDHQFGLTITRDQTRSRLDVVHILLPRGRGEHLHPVPADLLSQRGPFGFTGEHIHTILRPRHAGRRGAQQTDGEEQFGLIHRSILKTGARRGRRY